MTKDKVTKIIWPNGNSSLEKEGEDWIKAASHENQSSCEYEKKKQGCKIKFLSRLFKTDYIDKKSFYGVVKFNLLVLDKKIKFVPLGGIRIKNLNKLNMINSDSLAVLSEIKKKPTKIISRLF